MDVVRPACLIAVLSLLAAPAAGQGLRASTTPSPVVLDGLPRSIEIQLRGVPGDGPLRATVNVGRVDAIELQPGGARLLYVSPEGTVPHTLCLLTWRQGVAQVARVPLYGKVQIPVRAPRGAQITVVVGERRNGPFQATRSLTRVPVVLAPETREVRIEITDPLGVRTNRTLPLKRRPDDQLAVLALGGRELRVLVATAAPRAEPPEIEAGAARLPVQQLAPGLWQARWSLPNPNRRQVTVRAHLPGSAAVKEATVQLDPSRLEAAPHADQARPWHGVVGVSAGLLHNTGDLLGPHLGAELGLELKLPVGWVGLRGLVGVSWGSQEIAGPPAVGQARARVLLLPLGLALTYRLPLGVITPYVMAGLQAQLVRARATLTRLEGDQISRDWVTSVIGLLGAERELGPGQLFLQAGFQWGRLQSPRIELLAGGVVVEAGYRFRL